MGNCTLFNYPQRLATSLHPYLLLPVDPVADELAWQILAGGEGNVPTFLSRINNKTYRTCEHQIRTAPWLSCRAVGLAARFVRGYQEEDLENAERHLHAWVEVYLPEAGWRRYDPTLDLSGERSPHCPCGCC